MENLRGDLVLIGLLGLSLVAILLLLWSRDKLTKENSNLRISAANAEHFESSLAQALDKLAKANEEREKAVNKHTAAMSLIEERTKAFENEKANAEKLAKELQDRFKILANETLEKTTKVFLENAQSSFKQEQENANKSLKGTVEPLSQNLEKLKRQIDEIEKNRAEDKGKVSETLDKLGIGLAAQTRETSKLVNALQRSPTARGQWGDDALRNILELSGLTENIDYERQHNTTSSEGDSLIPDYVVRLPGGGCFVIDSKVAISAYLDAIDAEDEETRRALFAKHAHQLRTHVKQLAKKDYAKAVKGAIDFVALFVPGESFFSAAIEYDKELFDEALKQGIIVVTPATLLALTKAVSYGWRQRALEENAMKIAETGRELHERLKTFLGHMGTLGRGLKTATGNYNKAVASLEGRVLVSARRMAELNNPADIASLGAPEQVDDTPRLLSQDEDDET